MPVSKRTVQQRFSQLLPAGSLDRDLKIMFAANFLAAFGDGFVLYLLPLYIRSLGATPENVGLLYSLSTVAATVTMLPGGFLADRYDRKKILLAGWLIWTPIPLSFYFATSWTQLILPMFAYGVVISSPALNAYILEHAREEKMASAFTTLASAYAIGYVFSPGVAGVLSDKFGMRVIFILTAAFYFSNLIALSQITSQKPAVRTEADHAENADLNTAHPPVLSLVRVALLFALMMFMLALTAPLAPQYLSDAYKYGVAEIGLFGSTTYLGGFALSLAAGKIGDKHGKNAVIAFAMLLTSAGTAGYLLTGNFTLLLASSFLRGASFPMWSYIGVMAGSAAPTQKKAHWISMAQTAARVATIPAPYVGGVLYTLTPQAPFMLAIAIAAAIAIVVQLNRNNLKKRPGVVT